MSRENSPAELSPSTREASTVQVACRPLATALTPLFYFSLLLY